MSGVWDETEFAKELHKKYETGVQSMINTITGKMINSW